MKLCDLARPEAVDQLRLAILKHAPVCKACRIEIQESITGRRRIAGHDYCSDCYYDDLSAEIERMPLTSPRRTGS